MERKKEVPIITLKNVTKKYSNGFLAVNKLNLNVNEGDIYGFLGPNGAGKTTTIRMINGLLTPSEGEIKVNGVNVLKDPSEVKKIVGVLPESNGYYELMTSYEYLMLFAELYNVPKADRSRRVPDVLTMVGILDKKDVPIHEYSRGMKQRLGIAKSIIHSPKIIFLDEPTLGLDPQGQKDIQKIIFDLNTKEKTTVFITSHLLKEISEICNKVAIVNKGTLAEEGEIHDLINKYGTIINDSPNPITLEDIFFYVTKQGGTKQ